ncbi:MAG: hypothetical protein AVDCRST_MAG45-1519 [uncultured Solirubrobacterales bacterium]|uniref:DUF4446 domain-containing protein n=1 Tax=uncultured Solirubrobacterales bacterium TaxID=768556 RepID=A0A6J4ST75_9ACTN|nr:MAG: hypothetical protein AVDCRST_MAG45-1519 [uncultured Solirubrobacterales bacterium]
MAGGLASLRPMTAQELTSLPVLVAFGSVVIALAALVLASILMVRTRRLRRDQTVVLGDGRRDLVSHAEQLQVAFTQIRDWVAESMQHLDEHTARIEARLDGCLAYHSVIRYDAYGEMSGRQSSSIALLDAKRSGVVVSSILHRDQARFYVKPIGDGRGESELSPEEAEAVETALAAERV